MPVEELDVREQVLVEVSSSHQRPADCAHGVHGKAEDEQDDDAETAARKLLEPVERTS